MRTLAVYTHLGRLSCVLMGVLGSTYAALLTASLRFSEQEYQRGYFGRVRSPFFARSCNINPFKCDLCKPMRDLLTVARFGLQQCVTMVGT
jgi:hypothetical protein